MRLLGEATRQQTGVEPDETEDPSDVCDFGYVVVSSAKSTERPAMKKRAQHVIGGPAACTGLTLVDPYEQRPSPTAFERWRARNRRRVIYAVIYSIGGVVFVGKLLMWWLQ